MIFNAIPKVVSDYFGMIASGNWNGIVAGFLGLLGIFLIIRIFFWPWIKAQIMAHI